MKTGIFCRYVLLPALVLAAIPMDMARGAQPMEVLRRAIDTGIQILSDVRFQDPRHFDSQHRRLWEIVTRTVDFEEFSRRVLGPHWGAFTSREQNAFVEAFADFLRLNYLTRAQRAYSGENVLYVSQRQITEAQAFVKIKVLWRHVRIPVEVRMIKRQGMWRVYDAVVLGISVVRNYRAQFHDMLQNRSPAQVIRFLKQRTQQFLREQPP